MCWRFSRVFLRRPRPRLTASAGSWYRRVPSSLFSRIQLLNNKTFMICSVLTNIRRVHKKKDRQISPELDLFSQTILNNFQLEQRLGSKDHIRLGHAFSHVIFSQESCGGHFVYIIILFGLILCFFF